MAMPPPPPAAMMGIVIHSWGEATLHGCGHKPLGLSRRQRAVVERAQGFGETHSEAVWLRTSLFSALSLRSPICEMGSRFVFADHGMIRRANAGKAPREDPSIEAQ